MKRIILVLMISVVYHGNASAGPAKYTTRYDQYFKKYSKRFFGPGFDWRWFKAQGVAESALNEKAESWVKAKGIMQVMPATFEELKKRLPQEVKEGLPRFSDIREPRWNIAAGIYYNRLMWNVWKAERPFMDRLSFTFGSYNAGKGYLIKAQERARRKGLNENLWNSVIEVAPEVPRWRHRQTVHYVEKIRELVRDVDR